MEIEINGFAVLGAAFVSMLVGAIWYSRRTFGRYWETAANVAPRHGHAATPLIAAALLAVVTASGLAVLSFVLWRASGWPFLSAALLTAAIAWGAMAAPRISTHQLFENRPPKLIGLTALHELVSLIGMGLVVGSFPPAVTP